MVVDLGGGTLDVSLLSIQGGMFVTQGMAGKYGRTPFYCINQERAESMLCVLSCRLPS